MTHKTNKILVMGLPGSGKTYFADKLRAELTSIIGVTVTWYNADEIRKTYSDWDFSYEGRIRQSHRMAQLANTAPGTYCICDFVAPLVEMRNNFKADWTIWIDTIERGRYEDTNKAFIPPKEYDFRITEQNAEIWAPYVASMILKNQRRPVFDWQKETVQMLGRWQPWHSGHRALFERALATSVQWMVIMLLLCDIRKFVCLKLRMSF